VGTKRKVKTADQVREEFRRSGRTFTSWAREHGYTQSLVFEVLRGRILAKYGKSHEVAVLLGLKDGVIERRAA
jgi:gp16 family phage-associated protein